MEALLLIVLLVFGFVGYGLLKRHLWDQSQAKKREMIHRERMLAMEKGIPVDNLSDPPDTSEELHPTRNLQGKALVWVRLIALFAGLFLLPVGAGMCIAFYYANVSDLTDIWTVGLIPILGGIGLLLFVAFSRSFESSLKVE